MFGGILGLLVYIVRNRSLQIRCRDDMADDPRTARTILCVRLFQLDCRGLSTAQVYKVFDLLRCVAVYCDVSKLTVVRTPEPVFMILVFLQETRRPTEC